ncbi:MAG: D-sedoheptulose 7-phosphate isomerase [Euryarchaeota archaeon]|nr:D-sedoheptulose 7-phosphate isomerase [Euryarchaeota archaeon]
MPHEKEILSDIDESIRAKELLKEHVGDIAKAASALTNALRGGKKMVIFGNGGSAADAQHIAAELSGKFNIRDRPGLPGIALTVNTSALTAIGNDFSYDEIFSRQLEGLVGPGDVVIGISTSGNSPNILRAIEKGKELGATTVGMCGKGGKLPSICDISIRVPSENTPRIQEAHITVGHIICAIAERELFGKGKTR